MEDALHIPLPEGLEERLEMQIDRWALQEKKLKRRRMVYWATGMAATVLLAVGIFFPARKQQRVDTFTDPREAAIAATQMLAYLSSELNRGLEQAATVDRTFEQVNEIIKEHLNK